MSASNTTDIINLFRVYGNCEVRRIYGVVTTVNGNATSAGLRLTDGTTTVAITTVALDMSNSPVGSLLLKRALLSNPLLLGSSATSTILDPGAATNKYMTTPTVVNESDVGITYIVFSYATTDTPTTGAVDWYCWWQPLSVGSYIEAA